MKLLNKTNLLLLAVFALLFTACKKVEINKDLDGRGQTIVKFASPLSVDNGINHNLLNFGIQATPQTVGLIDVRRDIPNETELNKTLSVSIKEDAALLSNYNILNGTSLVPLPQSAYTVDASNPRANGQYTLTFNPGEFAKNLKVSLTNTNSLDLNNKYGIALTIVSAVTGADGRVSFDNRSIVIELGPLNKYDGVYKLSGSTLRAGDPAKTGTFAPVEMQLQTTGANTVTYSDLQVWADGTGVGIGIPQLSVDPATNKVTVSSSGGATTLAPADNYYDPAAKTFHLDFTWGAGPGSRRATVTLQYLRPR